jgi:hypothetical protein
MADEARRYPRIVALEAPFADLLPEVLLGVGPEEVAVLATRALTPRPEPRVPTAHLHVPRVSVREQAGVLVDRLGARLLLPGSLAAGVLGLGLLALMYPVAAFVVTLIIVLTIVLALRWVVRKLRGVGRRPVPA